MRKRAIIYVPVLPRELRYHSSIDSCLQITNSDLAKIGKKGREEEKIKKFSKKESKRKHNRR